MSYSNYPGTPMAGKTPKQGTSAVVNTWRGFLTALRRVWPVDDGTYEIGGGSISTEMGIVTAIVEGAGGGGGKREFGYQVPGELAIGLGGPAVPNITGATITFSTAIATVGTAPDGDDIECSLDVDGTTVAFTIADGATSSAKQAGLSVAWPADALITGSITVIGSSTAGSDLSMVLAE